MRKQVACAALLAVGALLVTGGEASASSHREAPFITKNPKVDNTDFYMFRSYEPGRDGFVTLIANFQPLQDAFGGPNYFTMDPDALYEIHIDNTGDGVEDITFQFRFSNALGGAGAAGINLDIGAAGAKKSVNIPFLYANVGVGDGNPPPQITVANQDNFRHVNERYTVGVVKGPRRAAAAKPITHAGGPGGNGASFVKPLDYVGFKTLGDYNSYINYSAAHSYGQAAGSTVTVPDCATPGSRVFVGQRQEGFAVNIGAIFDLVNAPVAALTDANGGVDNLYAGVGNKNVTTIALEIPIACLKGAGDVIAGWSSASVRQARVINPKATYARPSREGGAWAQVSRLGSPLVNEVVIGLKDKDKFNSSEPKDDAQFADYVTHPTFPAIVEAILGSATVPAPTAFPRADIVAAFLSGVPGVNAFPGANPKLFEALRLNVALPATPAGNQFTGGGRGLGAAGCFKPGANPAVDNKVLDTALGTCDPGGFPNGRRPGDDVVDIIMRVAMGYLLNTTAAPAADAPLGDGIQQNPGQFAAVFPYLNVPNAGSEN